MRQTCVAEADRKLRAPYSRLQVRAGGREPDAQWSGKSGFIAEHLKPLQSADQPFELYLCGLPPMVESIKTWLQDQREGLARLYFEKFTESNA